MVKSNLRPNIYKKGQWIHNKRQQIYKRCTICFEREKKRHDLSTGLGLSDAHFRIVCINLGIGVWCVCFVRVCVLFKIHHGFTKKYFIHHNYHI